GSKKRDVYLPSDTREVLAAYLQTRNMKESQYVFTTRKGRITNAYMGSLAHDISRKAGIQFSWHRARHTYAKSMIRSGIDLETLRLLLGHERLDTTQIYALKDQEEALNEVRRKKPSFFENGKRFESPPPCSIVYGPAGNCTFSFENGEVCI
ncbi:MAG: site-specific integrase, partial [Candidatus Parvarchaeota archaeon]